jgi:hypothetical protein
MREEDQRACFKKIDVPNNGESEDFGLFILILADSINYFRYIDYLGSSHNGLLEKLIAVLTGAGKLLRGVFYVISLKSKMIQIRLRVGGVPQFPLL